MSNLTKWLGMMKVQFDKHSPTILIGLGIAGMAASVIFAVKATPKAKEDIEKKKKELKKDKLNVKETVGATWKRYIPPAITFVASTGCIIGANSVNTRRNAALAAAYSLSETALLEYRDKVKEIVGEAKEESIRADIARDRMAADPPRSSEIIVTGKGETNFRESITQRYFKSDIEKVRKIENDLNRQMRSYNTISMNEVLYALGCPSNHRVLNDIGWDIDKHPLEFIFTPVMTDEVGVCVEIDYRYPPEPIV